MEAITEWGKHQEPMLTKKIKNMLSGKFKFDMEQLWRGNGVERVSYGGQVCRNNVLLCSCNC